MSATTTSAQILRYTTSFLSETLSQSHLRHHLFTTFLEKLSSSDQTTLKLLKFASETLENSFSTNSSSIRSSSLRLAEELLSKSENPFASFLLSLAYSHCRRPIDASLCLLDVFYADPSFTRVEIAPFLFEELFLVHFLPILEWYNDQRNKILSSLSLNTDYNSDDHSIVSNTTVLSKMSGDQATSLKDLERDYEDLLDENCRNFVGFFKEVLQNRDRGQLIIPPPVVLQKSKRGDKFHHREEKKIAIQKFGSRNGRYNPMWTEGDVSVEFNRNGVKSLSKFPSLIPERVSAKILIDERSSKISETASIHHLEATLESCTYDNLNNYSSSDSEAEQEEKIQKTASFDTRQSQSKKQKQFFLAESSRSPDHLMEDSDNQASGGKSTPPKDFVCPITTHVFYDPVTLETGQTYERKAIQEWIDRGNSTCPITRQKLHGTQLPKTNYVLKRLIASWKEPNPSSDIAKSEAVKPVNENKFKPAIRSASPNSVISQATTDVTMSELRLAITDLCTSEILRESELAVLKIERFWQEANTEMEMQSLLSKPPVINGFVEILFNSVDPRVLGATVLLLSDLGSRDDSVIQTLTRVDSDVECIVALFKKGLLEAVVLIYLLKPSSISLVEMEMVDSLTEILSSIKNTEFPKMFMKPEKASVILLGQILRSSDDSSISESVRTILSTKAIENIIVSLDAEGVEERIAAVGILLRCILEDGKCRNIIAEKAVLTRLLESFMVVNDVERFEIVHFLSELVKLNRRNLNEQILHILKDEGAFSTMHTLLTFLQNALEDQCPIVAGLLLQLDLLEEPRKMSIYREEAIDTLISCLKNSEYPVAQIAAAETVLSLQGRFSYSGKSLARAILLKRAGLDRSYKTFMQKDQRRQQIFDETQETMEEEQAAEWERKVAFVLASHEFGLLFEALAEGLKSRYAELQSVCFMSATWLIYMLSVLPDTGIRGAARVCLLKHFVSIFKSEKNTDDRALSMLALNSFVRDPDGLQDLTVHMKDILKGLRELKKSSVLAFEMLQVFSEEHDNSADLWNHKELAQEDCSINGEVLSIASFRGKIFSGHSDGIIKVWTCKGTLLHLVQEIQEHSKPVTSLVMLHSAGKLYSGSLDKTVRVWSIMEEGIHCEQVHETKDHINSLVVSNNIACYIPQGVGIKVHSWNGSSKVLNQNKYVKCLALVQGKLYCGCHDNSIQEIDLVSGTIGNIQTGSKKLLGKAYPIYSLQVQDGLIYSAGPSLDGANVKIWSTSNYNMVGSLPSTLDVREMVVSSELIYLGCKSGIVEVWCKKKQTRVETLQSNPNSKILCMALDNDKDILVIGTSDGRIQAWELS
ncbi:putative E3 ubiquitin-protein ligase LIN isoform X2 [Olea europaea var. sylvestris]|uniref:putative E3 ubiquitin-protein ligase LIN isoform X2 n=1 Tax=Olea europaea var. sylvestris TaxID=158386 RepID=UPI000C1CDD7A|nr:putative E3 ubiquitin-protein ligase LIN isoform X2 [Olea europaea var. sylvestris]